MNGVTRCGPQSLSPEEWAQSIEVPEIREAWGIGDETGEQFAKMSYAAKCHFVSGGPGYVGDPYFVYGDALSGDP
ncbi:MAG TPA: hypothetical protein VFO40_10135 [Chthoniobacterales bacterium]|nr:hypothetical protein [Chthoniobacterales bacterium]